MQMELVKVGIKGENVMMILKLVECSDWEYDYGFLIVKNEDVTAKDVQNKIYEFKNSYKAYGYSSLKEMKADGYKTVEELYENGDTCWTVDDLVKKAFPKSWKVSRYEFDGTVEC